MRTSFTRVFGSTLAALVLVGSTTVPAEAQRRGGSFGRRPSFGGSRPGGGGFGGFFGGRRSAPRS